MGVLKEIREYKQAFHKKILERLDRQLNVSREQLSAQVGQLIDKILDAEPAPESDETSAVPTPPANPAT